jgi:hypothetical protein
MSIEIREMSIRSQVVQRQADGDAGAEAPADERQAALPADWREQCRRLVLELLDARSER